MQIMWRDSYDAARMEAEPDLVPLSAWGAKKEAAMEQLGQKAPTGTVSGVPLCPGTRLAGKSLPETPRSTAATPTKPGAQPAYNKAKRQRPNKKRAGPGANQPKAGANQSGANQTKPANAGSDNARAGGDDRRDDRRITDRGRN